MQVHAGPHKYRRQKFGPNKYVIYKCSLVNCPHYKHGKDVIGALSICWYCGAVFTMTATSMLLKPHCGCRFKKSDPELDALLKELGDLE